MRYSRTDLLQLNNYHLTFDEDIRFAEDTYQKFPRIRKLENIHAKGDGNYDPATWRLYLNIHVTGTVICPCDVTSEDVPVDIDTEADEIFSFAKEDDLEIIPANGEYIEILPVVFQMILMEIPIKVVKSGKIDYPKGDGWEVMSEEAYRKQGQNRVDPRLAALKDYKPQD